MAQLGRPTQYSQEIADVICEEISTSNKSLKTICENEYMPAVRTVLYWLKSNEDFLHQYTRAKEEQADFLAEEIIEIADDSSNDTLYGDFGPMENKEWVNRSKLRVEARKWVASKLKPKKYGDKVDVTSGDKPLEGQTILIQGQKFAGEDKTE